MTATPTPTSNRPRPPADAHAVGWHLIPGRRSEARWWTGDDWYGSGRPYPVVPPATRLRVWSVVALGSTCVVAFVASMAFAIDGSWLAEVMLVCSVAAAALAVGELLRSAAAHRLVLRSPGVIGRAAWLRDPAGAHAWRWWDGHRFTPFVADPDPGATTPWSPTITGVDVGHEVSSDVAMPDWAHLSPWSGTTGAVALVSLVIIFAYPVVTVPAGLLAVKWGFGCVRNARLLGGPTPAGAVVGIMFGLMALALVVPTMYLWAAVGSAL